MRLQISFEALDEAMRMMGAIEKGWSPSSAPLPDLKRRLAIGIEIDLPDVTVEPNGALTYKGEQVLLYIKDTRKDRDTLLHRLQDAPRFHIAECRTLQTMREIGRFERYVVTNNLSGSFLVFVSNRRTGSAEEVEAELKVCKNCLQRLDYRGYASGRNKSDIWEKFDTADFFESYRSLIRQHPKYTDRSAPKPGYTQGWDIVSQSYRDSVGWRCEQCGVDLSDHRGLLHVHHRNGVTGDNARSNLRALCVLCHSEQPSHCHMRVEPAGWSVIMRLRATQRSQ